MSCLCTLDVAEMRSAQCLDDEIEAHALMHSRGKCPTYGTDEDLAEYQREVVMIRGYGMPRCGIMGGDGSIPGPVCVLPEGHGAMGYEPHYG